MSNLKFISTGSTTVTLSGNGLLNNFTANGHGYTLGNPISLADGGYVEFAGSTDDFSKDGSHYYQFSIDGTGTVEVEGDLISLINNNAYVKQYQFINLFKDCSKITSIANLNFPASIADFCYSNMFAGCTGLVNGGTTLPATATTRWCYNGMFAYCSSMTTPPTILATKIAPFCYYQMFVGCSSLTNGPQLYNTVVEGRMNSNCMFNGCSNLSTIQVSFTDWPAEADQNQSKNWLNGVAQNGLFVYPITLTIPTGVVPASWTLSATYPATIVADNITVELDAMLDQVQTSALAYGYVGGTETLNIAVDTTNKPAWLTYTTDSDSIDFSANGYSINTSASFTLPITFSAADAETKNVVATFNIVNYPAYTIILSSIPTFTFNGKSETNIISSLLDYVTYEGNTLSCEVEGTLPNGLSCVDGIITGIPSEFTSNFGPTNFNVIYSASDARNVSSSFDLEIINAAPDYSTLPMTFECVSGPINLSLPLYRYRDKYPASSWNGSDSKLCSMFYRIVDPLTGTGNWVDWKALNYTAVSLTAGQKIELSGQNYGNMGSYWGDYVNRFELSGTGEAILYGNISSLFRTDVETVEIMNIMLAGPGDYTYDNILTDASKFIIPYKTNVSEGLNVFCRYSRLRGGPLFSNTNYYQNQFAHQFENCSALSCVEASFIKTGSWSDDAFFDGIAYNSPSGIFILPEATYKPSKGTGTCPVNWIYLNRNHDTSSPNYGQLTFAQNATWKGEWHVSGDVFPTEDDPYAWYYNK